jgi:hypothetical protein
MAIQAVEIVHMSQHPSHRIMLQGQSYCLDSISGQNAGLCSNDG